MGRIRQAPVRSGRGATAGAVLLVLGLGLSGCGTPVPDATSVPTATTTAAPAGATPAAAPELEPSGTAADNLPFFDRMITEALAADPDATGRTYIDALSAGGFDKTQMEVTADTTTKGEPADSVQFSVRISGECLIGQHGPSTGGYHSVVAPLLATGTCLVGATRQIDW